MDAEDRLVTVYKACGQPEAEIVRGRLEIEGILALLKYESIGSVYGLTVDGLGQVEVQVPAKYADRAREIIESSSDETAD
ncbi:MAG: DUF2007 domain-containing protein [Chloroflexi bacterium]|nr:DUF2007 domain-containing protein [Chloroflexota bacterium]